MTELGDTHFVGDKINKLKFIDELSHQHHSYFASGTYDSAVSLKKTSRAQSYIISFSISFYFLLVIYLLLLILFYIVTHSTFVSPSGSVESHSQSGRHSVLINQQARLLYLSIPSLSCSAVQAANYSSHSDSE